VAFGNTVVLKPAEPTPATAAALADIIYEVGVPAGVFNMVFGGGAVGEAIVRHPGVDGISFTGSQATGAKVGAGAMARQARVQLEMGGKNPLLVLDDADLDRAVMCALDGSFFATGQRCTASSRLIVTRGIHDRFVEALAAKAAALKVGDALDPASQMGPLVNQVQMETAVISGMNRTGVTYTMSLKTDGSARFVSNVSPYAMWGDGWLLDVITDDSKNGIIVLEGQCWADGMASWAIYSSKTWITQEVEKILKEKVQEYGFDFDKYVFEMRYEECPNAKELLDMRRTNPLKSMKFKVSEKRNEL